MQFFLVSGSVPTKRGQIDSKARSDDHEIDDPTRNAAAERRQLATAELQDDRAVAVKVDEAWHGCGEVDAGSAL